MNATVTKFPKAMKRGAKVKKGPLAQIKPFPGFLAGDALIRRWLWLRNNYERWENEEFEGDAEDGKYGTWRRDFEIISFVFARSDNPVTETRMRSDIAGWVGEVKRRTEVKDWLESLGIDWDKARDPQAALAFAMDRITSNPLPFSA